jgi:hypothetical protein
MGWFYQPISFLFGLLTRLSRTITLFGVGGYVLGSFYNHLAEITETLSVHISFWGFLWTTAFS